MKNIRWMLTLAVLAVMPGVGSAQPAAMSPAMVGVGAHGYDWLIGTWTCTTNMASAVGGPATSTLTASRASAGSSIVIKETGKDFEAYAYVTYVPKTKTWWNPAALADGGSTVEWSKQTGAKTVFTGSYVNSGTGKTVQIRDTYTMSGMNKYTDLGEYQAGGAWKTQYNLTCTKS